VVGLDLGSLSLSSGHADNCSALAERCGKLLTHALVSSPAANLRIFPIKLNLHGESVQAARAIGWISLAMALPFSI